MATRLAPSEGEDCDDTNSAIHPGATEVPYDSIDQNCDGLSDFDGDQDGYDAESYGGLDCDDTVASINPSQVDIFYDGIDQNCDGRSDFDYDEDGEDADFANGLDCNDTDPTINTTAIEIYYDNIDQNCDDHSDDDSDFDGFDADFRGGNDCDDTNDQLNPNATEIPYDGIDQDCTGLDWNDIDNDGFIGTLAGGTDCNDNDADIHPGHAETWYDGIDQNCDGSSDFDSDYDGFDSDLYGGDDCDDTQSATFPGANDIPYDGIDSDCAGDDDYDADGDGYPLADDCDDNRSEAYPGATELENNLDDDCDGYSEQVDRDDDGLSDWQEWTLGTNPEDMDSDNDGLSDGDEAEAGSPIDSDGDGFINPLDPDDDGDGILTQAELTTDINDDGKSDLDVDEDGISNHLDLDSDNDGYTDAMEGEKDEDLDGIPDYLDYSGDYIGGGCGGGQNGGLLLSLLLLARRWRSLCLTLLIPSSALAQSFEIDGLQWLGELGIVESPTRLSLPDSQLKTPFAIGFLTSYAKNPILETTADGIVPLVDELVVNHLRLSGSPVDRLQLDLEMPFLAMGGLSTERFSGIGDLRLGIKGTILGEEKNTPGVGVSLLSWFPTGNSDLGLGNRYANMGLIASTQKSIGPLLLAANMGARVGPSDPIRNLASGIGPLMGLSVGIVPISSFGLHLECLSHGSAGWKKLPVELMGSSTWKISRRLWLSGSAGGGLTSGIGSPEWRALANVGWRWAPKQTQPAPTPYLIQVPREVNEQTRPHDRKQPVLAEIQDERIVLYDVIHFEEGSANLLPQSTPLLSAVLDLLIIHLEIQHLLIEGHTNHHGDYTSNLDLSADRSVAVMNWLVARGINPHRLVCKGYGSHRPLVSPDHPKAIEINRRVEFTILRPDPKSTSKP